MIVHREAHLGMVAIALLLVAASLAQGLIAEGLAQPIETAEPPEAVPSAFLEAVLVRTDLRPAPDQANATEPVCSPVRTVKTSYRPLLLVDRIEPACTAHEAVEVTLHVEHERPIRLVHAWLALCRAESYTMKTVPSGNMIGGVQSPGCQLQGIEDQSPADRLSRRLGATMRLDEAAVEATGLRVACGAMLVAEADGTTHLARDMTWFDVRAPEEVDPDRPAHTQSWAPDIPCSKLEIELPGTWPAEAEAPGPNPHTTEG